MALDLRIPMGLMFTLVGIILVAFGLATNGNAELYARCLGINANLFGHLHAGIVLGTADSRQRLIHGGAGENRLEGMTWGAYATWYVPQGFYVDLSAPANAVLGQASAEGLIVAPFKPSGLGRTVLAPVPAHAGEPVCLYFVDAPRASHWEVYAVDRQRLAALDFGAERDQCWPTDGVAPGLYRLKVHVDYANGVAEDKVYKIVVQP